MTLRCDRPRSVSGCREQHASDRNATIQYCDRWSDGGERRRQHKAEFTHSSRASQDRRRGFANCVADLRKQEPIDDCTASSRVSPKHRSAPTFAGTDLVPVGRATAKPAERPPNDLRF
jgi:hypothetical protein